MPPKTRLQIATVIERLTAVLGGQAGGGGGWFFAEVGADSLDLVELIMELEEECEIRITDEEAGQIRSLGDLIDLLVWTNQSKLRQQGHGASPAG